MGACFAESHFFLNVYSDKLYYYKPERKNNKYIQVLLLFYHDLEKKTKNLNLMLKQMFQLTAIF